jgi:hypothetical protein
MFEAPADPRLRKHADASEDSASEEGLDGKRWRGLTLAGFTPIPPPLKKPEIGVPRSPYGLSLPPHWADRREVSAMEDCTDDKWITRQELADRYGVPVKTPAEWASKGTGPRYAKFGRHVRYRLSDVIDWERKRFAEDKRNTA